MVDETTHLLHQKAMLQILDEFDRICKLLQIPYILFAGTLLGAVRHNGFVPWDDDLDVLMFREDYERFLANAASHLDHQRFYLQAEFTEHWPMFFSKMRLNGTVCTEKYRPKDREAHSGIYIDIFPCDDTAETFVGRLMQFGASKVVIAKSLDARGYQTANLLKRIFIACCRLLPMDPFLRVVKTGKRGGRFVHTFLAAGRRYRKNILPRTYFLCSTELDFCRKKYPVPENYEAVLRRMYGDYMCLPTQKQRTMKIHAIDISLETDRNQNLESVDLPRRMEKTRSIR